MIRGSRSVPLAHIVVRLLKGIRSACKDYNNETEFAAHKIIVTELKTEVTSHIRIPLWEKGAIENMNGFIRQYTPKKVDFKGIIRAYIRQVIEKLNNIPRKKNGFIKPKDIIKERIT